MPPPGKPSHLPLPGKGARRKSSSVLASPLTETAELCVPQCFKLVQNTTAAYCSHSNAVPDKRHLVYFNPPPFVMIGNTVFSKWKEKQIPGGSQNYNTKEVFHLNLYFVRTSHRHLHQIWTFRYQLQDRNTAESSEFLATTPSLP
jgi:hypothetical protein